MNQNDCSGKTLKLWPVFVDRYKPDNLRLASNSQNQYNSKSRTVRLNPDLPKGIHEDRPGYFRAYISKDGKSYRKGGKCLQTVINWLIDKRRALHGEFARA
jgi:hypothetical protein